MYSVLYTYIYLVFNFISSQDLLRCWRPKKNETIRVPTIKCYNFYDIYTFIFSFVSIRILYTHKILYEINIRKCDKT